jgi:hypothetical protein
MIEQQKIEAVDVEKQARHFEMVVDLLEKNRMEQNENFQYLVGLVLEVSTIVIIGMEFPI